jgi:hypothetical protein
MTWIPTFESLWIKRVISAPKTAMLYSFENMKHIKILGFVSQTAITWQSSIRLGYVVLMMNCVTCVETFLACNMPLILIDFCFTFLTFQSPRFLCFGFNVLVMLKANTAFQTNLLHRLRYCVVHGPDFSILLLIYISLHPPGLLSRPVRASFACSQNSFPSVYAQSSNDAIPLKGFWFDWRYFTWLIASVSLILLADGSLSGE